MAKLQAELEAKERENHQLSTTMTDLEATITNLRSECKELKLSPRVRLQQTLKRRREAHAMLVQQGVDQALLQAVEPPAAVAEPPVADDELAAVAESAAVAEPPEVAEPPAVAAAVRTSINESNHGVDSLIQRGRHERTNFCYSSADGRYSSEQALVSALKARVSMLREQLHRNRNSIDFCAVAGIFGSPRNRELYRAVLGSEKKPGQLFDWVSTSKLGKQHFCTSVDRYGVKLIQNRPQHDAGEMHEIEMRVKRVLQSKCAEVECKTTSTKAEDCQEPESPCEWYARLTDLPAQFPRCCDSVLSPFAPHILRIRYRPNEAECDVVIASQVPNLIHTAYCILISRT